MTWLRRLRDLPLWLIVTSFVAWEAFAHYVARNRGSHTLSNRIWAAESKGGIAVRVLVGLAIATLFTHLEFHLP